MANTLYKENDNRLGKNNSSIEQLNDLRQTKLNHLTDTEKKVIDTYGMCLSGVKVDCTEQVLTGTK